MVHGAEVVTTFPGRSFRLRETFQTDRKECNRQYRSERPIFRRDGRRIFGDSRDNRRVQTAGEQHAAGRRTSGGFSRILQRLTQRVFVGNAVFTAS